MHSVDPRHLLQFHEIIRTGSFTRAASALGLTQPALTRNMKLMESRLGFQLMVRSRQGIVTTPLGLRILEEANAIVLAERRIHALRDNLRRGYQAELAVGCTPTMCLHALAQPVAEFARDNPAVRLDMRQGHTGILRQMLSDQKVDVVLGPPEIADGIADAVIQPLFESPMVILASRHHPLANRPVVAVNDLNTARWAFHQPGTGIRQASDRLLSKIGVSDSLQANELPSNMILSLLRMGDHLAIVPKYVMQSEGLTGELVQLVLDTPPVHLAHAAIWQDHANAAPAVNRFVTKMKESLAALSGH